MRTLSGYALHRSSVEIDAKRRQRGGCGLHSTAGRDRPRDIGLRQIHGARAGLDVGRAPIVGLGIVLLVVVVRWPSLKSHQGDDQL